MLDIRYSRVIEATEDPMFFGFCPPDLPGFSGSGHSVEDCLSQAKWAVEEHVSVLQQEDLPVLNPNPTVLVQNDPRALRPAAAD
jgi:predicted RNase H-like HicB family nuclease